MCDPITYSTDEKSVVKQRKRFYLIARKLVRRAYLAPLEYENYYRILNHAMLLGDPVISCWRNAGMLRLQELRSAPSYMFKRVVIESPYAGDVERNVAYARACVADALTVPFVCPICSHLLFTQPSILNDSSPIERTRGIDAGLAWADVANEMWVYTDFGISAGMENAMKYARKIGLLVVKRQLPADRLAGLSAVS